jgi:hypothetical protein
VSEDLRAWTVRATAPRDYFSDSTVSVGEWFQRQDNLALAWTEFSQAFSSAMKHEYWEWPLGGEPRVGYDPVEDTHYFIFKIINNGTTFFVSRRMMSEIEEL